MTSEITKTNPEGESSIYQSTESFEFAQRQAKSLAESNLVPITYQGQKGLSNCLVALEMSKRMNLSPLTVMQNLNVIHGKPSWSAQFISSQRSKVMTARTSRFFDCYYPTYHQLFQTSIVWIYSKRRVSLRFFIENPSIFHILFNSGNF